MDSNWKKQISIFLASQGVSLFGSSVVQLAFVWYVAKETQSGLWVSLLTVCAYVPQFVISFFAGVWADRYSKKLLIILADAGIAVATLVLALFIPKVGNDTALLVSMMIISAIRSFGTGIQMPAEAAYIPELVPEDKYMKINSINSTISSLMQFVAPSVAGLVLSFWTFRATLFIDVATAAVGIGLLSLLVLPKHENNLPSEENGMFKDLTLGVKYVFSVKNIKGTMLTYGIFLFLCAPAGFLCSLFVSKYYADSYSYMTIVEIVGNIGMMLGGIIMSAWDGFKSRRKTYALGITMFGILSIGMGLAKPFVLYLFFMAIYGIALTIVMTSSTTILQECSDPNMQGRVFGLYSAIFSSFVPVGILVFGPLADKMSMRVLMVVTGVLLILLNIYMFRSIDEYETGKEALDD